MIIVDTNILLYATGTEHPLREACRQIVRDIGDAKLDAYVTDVVIGEFIHARARRSSRAKASALAVSLVDFATDILEMTPRARTTAIDLFAGSTRISINDAMIAAVAIEHGASVMTADADFQEIPSLAVIHPAER